MTKVHATRTFAPLQFEALEPHRFEDLVRDLMYDYRDCGAPTDRRRGPAHPRDRGDPPELVEATLGAHAD